MDIIQPSIVNNGCTDTNLVVWLFSGKHCWLTANRAKCAVIYLYSMKYCICVCVCVCFNLICTYTYIKYGYNICTYIKFAYE